ncbi:hypothetical protein, conserved [Eimeria brunetti]|uniref:Uncharacterized protein n=1 Tax=Eimeria brunetti TaxID=51314 RepID=U6LQA8_9EIME|nr:hypothetical protein, conserved [Eimeria brunetti]
MRSSIRCILHAYAAAARILKWEDRTRGPLADAGDEAAALLLGPEAKSERGGPPCWGPSCCSPEAAAAAAAAVGKMAPMCLSPVSSAVSSSAACEMVGELTLGAVALLQHGELPGSLQCIDSSSAAAVLQRRRLQALVLQQRLASRRRMQRAAEGPQRAVLLSQRLTALALSSLAAASCSKQQQQQQQQHQWGRVVSPICSPASVVEIVDAEAEGSSGSCLYTSEAAATAAAAAAADEADEAACGVCTPHEDTDIMETLEQYSPLGVFSFVSVATALHAGDELRQALLQQAAEKQQKAAGRSKGGRGSRSKGAALDPQAKLEFILSTLECQAS